MDLYDANLHNKLPWSFSIKNNASDLELND